VTPNDPYRGRTAPLTFKRCILYIYSTNKGTENFKHGIYYLIFPLQNAVCFIILTCLVPVLFTFKKKFQHQKVNAIGDRHLRQKTATRCTSLNRQRDRAMDKDQGSGNQIPHGMLAVKGQRIE
jgi:hypothetical protein